MFKNDVFERVLRYIAHNSFWLLSLTSTLWSALFHVYGNKRRKKWVNMTWQFCEFTNSIANILFITNFHLISCIPQFTEIHNAIIMYKYCFFFIRIFNIPESYEFHRFSSQQIKLFYILHSISIFTINKYGFRSIYSKI